MPTYFDVDFELNKSETAIRSFCDALLYAGLSFKSGFLEFDADSLSDIIRWNQAKLDANFRLGPTDHHSHDYKQILFNYQEFTEVRLFIMNDETEPTFHFYLIIPEDDFLERIKIGTKSVIRRRTERMEPVKSLAKKVWNAAEILAIQTGWEGSGGAPSAEQIAAGTPPRAEPFCIIDVSSASANPGLPFETAGRNGILIEDLENWRY